MCFICTFVFMNIPFEQIKNERIKKGISQVDMAKAAGMSRSAYVKFENNGSDNLSLKSAIGISEKLNFSFNSLFSIDEKSNERSETIESVLNALEITIAYYLDLSELSYDKNKESDIKYLKDLTLSIEELKSQFHGVLTTFGFCKYEDILTFYKKYPEHKENERKRMNFSKS